VTIKGSVAVIGELVRAYPQEVVLAQLKKLYRTELDEAIAEANKLLPRYRTVVEAQAYARARAGLMLVAAYSQDDSMGVRALERSLKYVRKQQRAFAETND